MNEQQFAVAAPGGIEDLKHLVEQLRSTIERAVAGYARVVSRPADIDDGEFSQDLLVSSQRGQLEVAVLRGKGSTEAEVSVSVSGSRVGLLPIVLALLVAFVADKMPELLPVFRGLRVMLGAVSGYAVGMLLVGLLGAVGLFRRQADSALQQSVNSAVREVMAARGARIRE